MSNSFVTPWTIAHQTPLSTGFPRQEYWSGLPFPPPGDLLDPGFKPMSPTFQTDCLPLSHWGRHIYMLTRCFLIVQYELPRWLSGKESICNTGEAGSHEFDPWDGKIAWRRKWQPTPAFLPGESHGQRNLVGYTVHRVTKSQTRLSDFTSSSPGKNLIFS